MVLAGLLLNNLVLELSLYSSIPCFRIFPAQAFKRPFSNAGGFPNSTISSAVSALSACDLLYSHVDGTICGEMLLNTMTKRTT